MTDDDFNKPIVAVSNSFTQFVPGHVHLRNLGKLVADEIEAAGGVAKEFNTIAVDDGIAMGHDGMLYSLPSRDLIADSVEYMVNAHCADALVCISNCDKITPGMLIAAMRLNVPTVFVSGGPMEAGKTKLAGVSVKLDLINPMISAGDSSVSDEDLLEMERSACPTCGSCSGMFTANSMNCLTEALGLSLPGNGTVLATHSDRRELFCEAGRRVVDLARRCYEKDDESVLPRSIATKTAFENAMRLDIAMGGSTNTVLHILAAAREGEVDFTMADIDRLSRSTPNICKVAPSTQEFHVEDVHRAGGIMGILGELDRGGLLDTSVSTVHSVTLADALEVWDVMRGPSSEVVEFFRAGPAGIPTQEAFSQSTRWPTLDTDRDNGCIRSVANPYNADGGLAVLYGNIAPDGCIVKTAGVDESILRFSGPARVFESQDEAVRRDPRRRAWDRGPATWWSSGTRAPAAGPACRRCSTRRRTSRPAGWARSARCSPTAGSRAALRACPSATPRRKRPRVGAIALIRDGDMIDIDIPNRTVNLRVDDAELERRRAAEDQRAGGWKPPVRRRQVSAALQAYAAMATSADKGAVRDVSRLSG